MISIGLKGIDPINADKIERLMADTVSTLADNGIDRRCRPQHNRIPPRSLPFRLAGCMRNLFTPECLICRSFASPQTIII
jgi:hypothetical protein